MNSIGKKYCFGSMYFHYKHILCKYHPLVYHLKKEAIVHFYLQRILTSIYLICSHCVWQSSSYHVWLPKPIVWTSVTGQKTLKLISTITRQIMCRFHRYISTLLKAIFCILIHFCLLVRSD